MNKSIFWISATPMKLVSRSIDLQSADVEAGLLHPPESRNSGWNMDFPKRTIKRDANSLTRGDHDYGTLTLLSNGHMEFIVPINENFCWPQKTEEFQKTPRFSPYAVSEFLVSFLRLYRLIVDQNQLNGPFVISVAFKTINGMSLWPGHPMSPLYGSPLIKSRPFSGNDLILDPLEAPTSFSPDEIAYKLIVEIYGVFGHRAQDIPFYDNANGRFNY